MRPYLFISIILLSLLATARGHAAEVIVVADTRLKPMVEVVSGMGKILRAPVKTFLPYQVKGRLEGLVAEERARVVVALGKEALVEALRLPPSVLVIYSFMVLPPQITRPNTTGFYMASPAREYADFLHLHLTGFSRIAVVGSRKQIDILVRGDSRLTAYPVQNSRELVSTVSQVNTDAILLLPDVSLLTPIAMEEAFLVSFRKKIPLLGVSERNVKDGALLALVVDPVDVGRRIGKCAAKALQGVKVGKLAPAPPEKFELFLNLDTARKMGIHISENILLSAKRIYP